VIIALSGPSGIGKGVVKQSLLAIYPFITELIWYTTRPPRPGLQEINRAHISRSEFEGKKNRGEIILVQELFGNYYGLKKADLLADGEKLRLTEIHPDNLQTALQVNPSIITIGLITADMSLLKRRLETIRRTETQSEIQLRLTAARSEIQTILRNRSNYADVIEVCEKTQDEAVNKAIATVAIYLKKARS